MICECGSRIVDLDINYALVADRMYKKKLKQGDLDAFGADRIADMEALAAHRKAQIDAVYKMIAEISK